MNASPLTLVIETASPIGGVLLATDGRALGVRVFRERQAHTRDITRALDELFCEVAGDRAAGLDRLERVIVDHGPGSSTGVRIGLAVARMIGWQREVPVLGVSSLDAGAFAVGRAVGAGLALVEGDLVVTLPCRRRVVFARRYAIGESGRVEPLGEADWIDVGLAVPEAWQRATVVGAGLRAEPTLARAVASGALRSIDTAPPAREDPRHVPPTPWWADGWPTVGSLWRWGVEVAATLEVGAWAETVAPMYLSPVLAKTLAVRQAEGTGPPRLG